MKRFELYVDNNNKLVLSEFKTTEAEYESRILKGAETYEYIRRLATSKIVDICEFKKRNDVMLEYKNYIINISDYDEVFRKKGVAPLLRNIKEYEERPVLKENKSKKVKRKNKHVGRKIIATGLTLIILGACASNLLKKEERITETFIPNIYSTEMKLDESTMNLSNKFAEGAEYFKLSTEDDANTIYLNYEDWSSTRKANITKSYYSGMISKYAKMYGIDPKLAIAVATQESDTGIHKSTIDPGGATGLMQIQNDVWVGNNVSAYNFETKQVETLKVTKNRIEDVEYNIKIGCMILQNAMEYMNHNILAGIQCYNMGCGNLNTILEEYSKHTGKSIDDILSNVNDTGWMDFRSIISVGEQEYVEKVFSWIGEEVNIKNVKRDGSLVSINVGNQIENKKVY